MGISTLTMFLVYAAAGCAAGEVVRLVQGRLRESAQRVPPQRLQHPDGRPIVLRHLTASDIDKGYLELLSQLTVAAPVSRQAFKSWYSKLQPDYFVYVIEDEQAGCLIGSGTLVIERKLIHSCGTIGHIEDVVVHDQYRGMRLGMSLITTLVTVAEKLGCYKVILDCDQSKVSFYEKCGLSVKGVQMVKYFEQ